MYCPINNHNNHNWSVTNKQRDKPKDDMFCLINTIQWNWDGNTILYRKVNGKCRLSANWWPFCLSLNILMLIMVATCRNFKVCTVICIQMDKCFSGLIIGQENTRESWQQHTTRHGWSDFNMISIILGHNYRYSAYFKQIKAWIENGHCPRFHFTT